MVDYVDHTTKSEWSIPESMRRVDHTQCPGITGEIQLKPKAFGKIQQLMQHFTSSEWLAYLSGKWDGKSDIIVVDDIMVPEQVAGAASVHEVKEAPPHGTIGVIHSHVQMGAFFSGTDMHYINDNHDISIVVSMKTGDTQPSFKSVIRKTVACGVSMIMELPVTLTVVSHESWLKGAIGKVKSYVFKPAPNPSRVRRPYDNSLPWYKRPEQGRLVNPDESLPTDSYTETGYSHLVSKNSYERCVTALAGATSEQLDSVLVTLDSNDLLRTINYLGDLKELTQPQDALFYILDGELERRETIRFVERIPLLGE